MILNFCGNPGISSDTDSHSGTNDMTVFNFLLFIINAKGYNIKSHWSFFHWQLFLRIITIFRAKVTSLNQLKNSRYFNHWYLRFLCTTLIIQLLQRVYTYKWRWKLCRSWSAGFCKASWSGSTLFSKWDIFMFSVVRVKVSHRLQIVRTRRAAFWQTKDVFMFYNMLRRI